MFESEFQIGNSDLGLASITVLLLVYLTLETSLLKNWENVITQVDEHLGRLARHSLEETVLSCEHNRAIRVIDTVEVRDLWI